MNFFRIWVLYINLVEIFRFFLRVWKCSKMEKCNRIDIILKFNILMRALQGDAASSIYFSEPFNAYSASPSGRCCVSNLLSLSDWLWRLFLPRYYWWELNWKAHSGFYLWYPYFESIFVFRLQEDCSSSIFLKLLPLELFIF